MFLVVKAILNNQVGFARRKDEGYCSQPTLAHSELLAPRRKPTLRKPNTRSEKDQIKCSLLPFLENMAARNERADDSPFSSPTEGTPNVANTPHERALDRDGIFVPPSPTGEIDDFTPVNQSPVAIRFSESEKKRLTASPLQPRGFLAHEMCEVIVNTECDTFKYDLIASQVALVNRHKIPAGFYPKSRGFRFCCTLCGFKIKKTNYARVKEHYIGKWKNPCGMLTLDTATEICGRALKAFKDNEEVRIRAAEANAAVANAGVVNAGVVNAAEGDVDGGDADGANAAARRDTNVAQLLKELAEMRQLVKDLAGQMKSAGRAAEMGDLTSVGLALQDVPEVEE